MIFSFCFLRNMGSLCLQCSLNKLICSICTDYFTDPVTMSCGHRFCSPCLCIFWEDVQTPVCCPVCQKISQKIGWQSIIFAEKQTAHTIICMIHKKVKDLICETDKKFLCVLCSAFPEHATHRLCPMQQAAEYCRVSIDTENTLKSGSLPETDRQNQGYARYYCCYPFVQLKNRITIMT